MTLFPLPNQSTLRKRIASFVCATGIQDELFKLLGLKLSNEPELYKQSGLTNGHIFSKILKTNHDMSIFFLTCPTELRIFETVH